MKLSALFRRSRPPNGWSDDFTLSLPDDLSSHELAERVLERLGAGVEPVAAASELAQAFHLSVAEATMVVERVQAGAFRARLFGTNKRPNSSKDPFAAAAYDILSAR